MDSMNIHRYKKISSLIQGIDDTKKELLQDLHKDIVENLSVIEAVNRKAIYGSRNISDTAESLTRFSDDVPLEERERKIKALGQALNGEQNLVHMIANLSGGFTQGWKWLEDVAIGLDSGELLRVDDEAASKREQLQDLSNEFHLNQGVCVRFSNAAKKLAEFRGVLLDLTSQMIKVAEKFFVALSKRHSSEGVKVWRSPVLTDFAMSVYNNIVHHGGISEKSTESQLSTYSMRQAIALIDWSRDDDFKGIILSEAPEFTLWIKRQLRKMWKVAVNLEDIFQDEINEVSALYYARYRKEKSDALELRMKMLDDLDPNKVRFEDRSATFSEEEIRNLKHRNDVLNNVCSMLLDSSNTSKEIADYVYEQAKKLRQHYLEVNSFYVCRIGQGNPMMGTSSGGLEVTPGKRPSASFDDIIGSGFDELRNFSGYIKRMQKFGDLFLMTSPRNTHDRANVLLIGPQGCGKTEALRAVANEEDSIAIFAQGSDFLTSWLGEAQKNPKRLFEAAVKLHKESGKHVHILIDEIDSVINDDYSTTKINLTLEFQMIMDGVVEYPHISVWGTTNHPERIPMPMIRRFAKLLIVGKLDSNQRVKLLKHFFKNLPIEKMSDEQWRKKADRLEHATGDVIRKIADHVWREEISKFIEKNPDDAEKMVDILTRINREAYSDYQPELDSTRADREVNKGSYGGGKTSKRQMFMKQLRHVLEIEGSAIDRAIDIALDNIGIINEIQTAKKTYEDAERFLAEIKSEREGAPSRPGAN